MAAAYPAPLPHLGSLLGSDAVAGGTLGALTLAASASVTGGSASAGDPAPLPSLGLALFEDSGTRVGQLNRTLGTLTCAAAVNIPLDERPAYDFWDEPAAAVPYFPVARQLDWLQTDVQLRADVGGAVAAADNTLAALFGAADGTVDVVGTTDMTLGVLTSAAAGRVDVTTTTVQTLGALTVAGLGDVTNNYVASLFGTLGALTSVGAGGLSVTADAAPTLGELAVAAAGAVSGGGPIATLDATLGELTLQTAGGPAVEGAGAVTLGALAVAGAGSVLSDIVVAVNQYLGALTSEATAQALVYELGVRRRTRVRGHERRIGERVVRARETEIEGEPIT